MLLIRSFVILSACFAAGAVNSAGTSQEHTYRSTVDHDATAQSRVPFPHNWWQGANQFVKEGRTSGGAQHVHGAGVVIDRNVPWQNGLVSGSPFEWSYGHQQPAQGSQQAASWRPMAYGHPTEVLHAQSSSSHGRADVASIDHMSEMYRQLLNTQYYPAQWRGVEAAGTAYSGLGDGTAASSSSFDPMRFLDFEEEDEADSHFSSGSDRHNHPPAHTPKLPLTNVEAVRQHLLEVEDEEEEAGDGTDMTQSTSGDGHDVAAWEELLHESAPLGPGQEWKDNFPGSPIEAKKVYQALARVSPSTARTHLINVNDQEVIAKLLSRDEDVRRAAADQIKYANRRPEKKPKHGRSRTKILLGKRSSFILDELEKRAKISRVWANKRLDQVLTSDLAEVLLKEETEEMGIQFVLDYIKLCSSQPHHTARE